MTPFERFCKESNVLPNSEFLLEHEGENYCVVLEEDDESEQVKFKVLEVLSGNPEYGVGETLWGYISGLTPVAHRRDSAHLHILPSLGFRSSQ